MMKGTTVILMVLTGLCFLPSCFPRLYILVEKPKTWAEAQTYCRWKYTDLASVRNEQDLAELKKLLEEYPNVWIGLHADSEAWRWSLENQGYYGEGEAGFRMWADGEPTGGPVFYKLCVSMGGNGKWTDDECYGQMAFFCYNKSAVQIRVRGDNSAGFIFVNEMRSWDQARKYCRKHYTDLASVRNQAENDQLKQMIKDKRTWIGLYRDSWKWSDGSAHSFSNWASSAPSKIHTNSCAVSNLGKWVKEKCNQLRSFVCYSAPRMRKQVVKVELKTTDPSVDVEERKEDILQKFEQRLKDHDLGEDVKLRWVQQPDGKVSSKKRTYKKEKKSCTLK